MAHERQLSAEELWTDPPAMGPGDVQRLVLDLPGGERRMTAIAFDGLLHELEDAGLQGRPGAGDLAPCPARGLQGAREGELRPAARLHPHRGNRGAAGAS